MLTSLHSLTAALHEDGPGILDSLDSLDALTGSVGGLLGKLEDHNLPGDIADLNAVTGVVAKNTAALDRLLAGAVTAFGDFARITQTGNWADIYLCSMSIESYGQTAVTGSDFVSDLRRPARPGVGRAARPPRPGHDQPRGPRGPAPGHPPARARRHVHCTDRGVPMRPLRERNQVAVAIVGTILVAAVVLLSVNLDRLPFAQQHAGYHAEFANASGLRVGDDVRVEGIAVGAVTGIHVVGDRVRVDFTAQTGLALGAGSDASIEVATVLGQVFLQVESHGPGTLATGGTIPLSRTTVPFTLVSALDAFGTFANGTDLPKLRSSLRTLATTLSGIAPGDARAALNGLADVSRTLASKQQQIAEILDTAGRITDTVNANSGALVQLLTQGDEFLHLLRQRQAVIANLLTDTAHLGSELSELMGRNAAQLAPLLANLAGVTKVLAQDKDELAAAITRLGSFSVNLSNATGAGPWLDLLAPVALTPDNVIRACGVHPDSSRGPCG